MSTIESRPAGVSIVTPYSRLSSDASSCRRRPELDATVADHVKVVLGSIEVQTDLIPSLLDTAILVEFAVVARPCTSGGEYVGDEVGIGVAGVGLGVLGVGAAVGSAPRVMVALVLDTLASVVPAHVRSSPPASPMLPIKVELSWG